MSTSRRTPRRSNWNPNAPATPEQVAAVNRLLADRVLTGSKYEGHTTAPALTRLQANEAISGLQRLPYPDDGCRGAEPCGPHYQCSRHSMEYQSRYGRAWNE